MKEKVYQEIDQFIYETAQKIDLLFYLTPINLEEENKKFIEKYKKGEKYNPSYTYQNVEEVCNTEDILMKIKNYQEQLKKEAEEINKLFYKALQDILNLVLLCQKVGKAEEITAISEKLYGRPSEELVKEAKRILKKEEIVQENLTKTSFECKQIFEEELKRKNIKWTIQLKTPQASHICVTPEKKVISINQKIMFSENDIKRLCVHEIGTHVLRAEYGSRQPYKIFGTELASNIKTEEGLATANEEKNGLLDKKTFRIYAARVIAVYEAMNQSFYDTYQKVSQFVTKEDALTITARVKRGLANTELPGAFTKDYIYLDGYNKVKKYLEKGKIEDLYVGIINLENVETCKRLIKKGYLKSLRELEKK